MLEGYRIVDLTSVVLGPFATQMLGDLGAEIIKVEQPSGDIMRHAGPMRSPGMGPIYLSLNRNKRAMALDLRKDAARDVLTRLIATADVLIHNVRAAGMRRLGFDYEAVKKIKSDIVYVHAVGFGTGGQYEGKPAYDDLIQAVSGLTSMLPRQDGSGHPRYIPGLVADKTTGLFAANATLAGLLHRERTGEGQLIEVPMMECMVAFNMVENLFGHTFVPPLGDTAYSRSVSPNRKPYATKDGHIAVMPYSDEDWRRFFALGGMDELADDPRYKTYPDRTRNIDDLYRISEEICAQRTTEEWMQALGDADIPCMRVHTLETVLQDPQINATGFVETRKHPTEGEYLVLHQPMRFGARENSIDTEPPKLGADNEAILSELGYSTDEIGGLRDAGAIVSQE